jgi:hypothetical protein
MFKRGCVVVLVMLASACSTGSIATPTPMPTPTPPTTSTLTGGPWPIDLALPPSRVPTFRLRRTAVPTFFCNVGFKRLVPDFQRASWNLSLTITAAGYFTHTAPSVKMPFPIDVPAVQRRHVQLFGRGGWAHRLGSRRRCRRVRHEKIGAPGRTRTFGPRLRRPVVQHRREVA